MKVCVLASGSKGNVTYIETKNHKILLDMGKKKKYIVDALKQIDVDPKEIDIILISHLHSDHISALEKFIKTYKVTVCMPQEMFASLDSIQNYEHSEDNQARYTLRFQDFGHSSQMFLSMPSYHNLYPCRLK